MGKGINLSQQTGLNKVGERYRVTQKGTEAFRKTFVQIMEQLIHGKYKMKAGIEELDEDLSHRLRTAQNTEETIEEFQEALDKHVNPHTD
jgi:IS1 family transposase